MQTKGQANLVKLKKGSVRQDSEKYFISDLVEE